MKGALSGLLAPDSAYGKARIESTSRLAETMQEAAMKAPIPEVSFGYRVRIGVGT